MNNDILELDYLDEAEDESTPYFWLFVKALFYVLGFTIVSYMVGTLFEHNPLVYVLAFIGVLLRFANNLYSYRAEIIVAEKTDYLAEIAAKEAQIVETLKSVESVKAESQSVAKKALTKIQTLNAEIDSLRKAIETLHTKTGSLNADRQALNDEKEAVEKEFANFRTMYKELLSVNESLQGQIESLKIESEANKKKYLSEVNSSSGKISRLKDGIRKKLQSAGIEIEIE